MRNKVQELAGLVNDIMMNPAAANTIRIRRVQQEVHQMAMKEAKVTPYMLQDEFMEDDPRVLLYWSYNSQFMAMVYNEAANQLHYVKGWNEIPERGL